MNTKQEALKLWCPMVRMEDTFRPGFPLDTFCLADECAMWRWNPKLPKIKTYLCLNPRATSEDEAGRRPAPVPASWYFFPYDGDDDIGAVWIEPDDERFARRNGYCGLAGKPGSA